MLPSYFSFLRVLVSHAELTKKTYNDDPINFQKGQAADQNQLWFM
jgi:hypothetical protein